MTDHTSAAAVPRPIPVRAVTPSSDAAASAQPPATPEPEAPAEEPRSYWKLILTILALGGMSAAFLFLPINWEAMGNWGYLGIFGVVFVATASVALPIPYLVPVGQAAPHLNPFLLILVAGIAGALGELSGYVLGASGRALIPENKLYQKANHWMVTYGFWCIVLFAFIPNPVFDAIGFAAGVLRYPLWRFALSCFLGKALKFAFVVLAALYARDIVFWTCAYFPDACSRISVISTGILGG
jgi:membrane protein YqaA with SNARE-associated domain